MKKPHWILLLCGTLLVLLLAPSCGPQWLWPTVGFEAATDEVNKAVYLKLRLPRALLAFIAGGALAVSGVAFQALFRNPLASPFTLGVSGGAAVTCARSR